MTRAPKTVVCMLSGVIMISGARGVTPDPGANPYQEIVDRNVFGLKPPPPPPDPEANKPPPPKVVLTGIMTIFGNKRALMKTTPTGKPGEPPKEVSYIIAEGTRDGDLEVLAIDEKAGTVKINYAGVASTLNFEQNGVKLTGSAPPPAGAPGALPMPGGIAAPNPGPGGNPFVPGAGGFNKAIPTRTLRLPGASDQQGGAMGSPSAGAFPPQSQTGIPSYGNGNPANPSGSAHGQNWPPEQNLSREEQIIMIEAERERLRQKGSSAANLLPSTPVTPGQNHGAPAPQ
jgi:hypothetical protein